MSNLLTKIVGDKREWKAMEARASALPRDYRIVYREMKSYLWRLTTADGMDIIAVLEVVLSRFETGAAQDKGVLDITGEDVAAFCHERLSERPSSYANKRRTSLNHEVAQKLAQ